MEVQMEKSDTTLTVRGIFRASADRLFQAWTDPVMMNRWFHPDAQVQSECTVDLHIGGRYEIRMRAAEDQVYVVEGVYEEIIPGERLVFTWRWQTAETTDETLVSLDFRPLSDKETELTLYHERFPNFEERDSHAQGWQGTFVQLAGALA
jgi:uncharacterized protein YndB with AHSA1/START domain